MPLNSVDCGPAFRSWSVWTGGQRPAPARRSNECRGLNGSVPVPRTRRHFGTPALRAELSTGRKVLAFGTMCLGCFMAYADIQILIVSIQEIGGGFAASQVELSWMMTSYLIGEIIVIPLSAWLSRVMSTRWLLTASAAGFTVASLLCSMAWDVRSMIVFRALQGFFGGSMIPATQTAAITLFRDKKSAVFAVSIVAAIAGLAPTLGPVLGGWITRQLVVAMVVLHQHRTRQR